ncbi:hypothetical protein [Actinokineospora sp.]|uniref:hypothetical protein n=1 Tax=Actinokineospora sp. TaxID=1872133 RepID=UPI004037AECB
MDGRGLTMLESGFGWVAGAPKFACRWSIKAFTPEFTFCTTLFDLLPNRRHVVIYPAAVSRFSVRLDRTAVEMLGATLETRDACAVLALHPLHGNRLLGLRPLTEPKVPAWSDRPADAPPYLGPMELYLELPDDGIRVLFLRERLYTLTDTLAEIRQALR